MLRTNLSTRPFYNERIVYVTLGAAALVVAALTVFNGVELRTLSGRHQRLVARADGAEAKAARLRRAADAARRRVDRDELAAVAAATREANELIDQRTFSWTGLLNRLETTLPADVKIHSIKPSTDKDGRLTVVMVAIGRRAEDIETFVEQLQATGAFDRLYSRAETTTAQGALEVTLEGRYEPAAAPRVPAPAAPAAARPQAPAREE